MNKTLLALSAIAALAVAGVGAAQPAANTQAPAAHGFGQHMQRMDPAKMGERRAQRLRDTLQLTPAQDGALKTFLDATQPKGGLRERMQERRQDGQALTTPQRLERARKAMTERQARFNQIASATIRFYNQLTPAQQKAFDAQHGAGRGGKGHMGGGRGHGGMRGGPPGGPQ